MELYKALNKMRALSKENIPFKIKYISYNSTNGQSKGVKVVEKCLLRTGLSKEISRKANVLISYVDLKDDTPKCFYLPLLLELNKIEIE